MVAGNDHQGLVFFAKGLLQFSGDGTEAGHTGDDGRFIAGVPNEAVNVDARRIDRRAAQGNEAASLPLSSSTIMD